jgi:predicted  nucleic acid-binding Zn-ribbon protein
MDKLLKDIRDICRAIAKGNYDYIGQLEELTIHGRHPREITDLAESFSMMLVKIQAHEYQLEKALNELKEKHTHLKDQVHTLKIDIDKMKKASTVAQITQSAFFKEIKEKAKGRRKK